MHKDAHHAALEALRFWIAQANGGSREIDAPAPVREAARLVCGGDDPPRLDLNRPLATVFSRIQGAPRAYVPRAPLTLDEKVLFPSADPQVDAQATARLCAALRDEDARCAQWPLEPRVEALLFAFQRYAWRLPSPLDGVSLSDVARVHAATAAALTVDAENLLLVGGDISGVQDFISSVRAAGATRRLRGRSFYLHLLTEACAHYVLHETGMPLCNLLYAGGGRWYALLPGMDADRLGDWRRAIGERLLDAHDGALYLALGGVPFAPADYTGKTWSDLSHAIDDAKRRRFADLDDDRLAALFEPVQPKPPRDEAVQSEEPPDAMDESLEDLGRQMARVALLAVTPGAPPAGSLRRREAQWHDVLRSFGLQVFPLETARDYRPDRLQRRRILLIDDSTDLRTLSPGAHDVVGVRYTVAVAQTATEADVAQYKRLQTDADDDQELRNVDI